MQEDLLELVENRGDLLRKDKEHHRQKMQQMKQDFETKERQLRETSLQDDGQVQENGMFNESDPSRSPPSSKRSYLGRSSKKLLTRDVGTFQDKPRQSKYGRQRKVKEDSDEESDTGNEADDEEVEPAVQQKGNNDPNEQLDTALKENDDAPEPFCDPADVLIKNGLDANGNPIAWDISTHDGRWLQWRDSKIRQGTWRGGTNQPGWELLDKMCPYDSRRPRPENIREQRAAYDFMFVWRPPLPIRNPEGVTSTNKALDVAIPRKPAVSHRSDVSSPSRAQPRSRRSSLVKDSVGLPIPWDRTTRGGRWLMKRDSYIRLGTYRVPKSRHLAELDESFPYDATMSRSQLDKYNETLRLCYRHTTWPVTDLGKSDVADNPHPPEDAESMVNSTLHSSEPPESSFFHAGSQTDFSRPPASEHEPQILSSPPHSTTHIDLTSAPGGEEQEVKAAAHDMPDSAFIRSRRLAFFAQNEAGTGPVSVEAVREADNITQLMKRAGISLNDSGFGQNNSASSVTVAPGASHGTLHSKEPDQPWPHSKQPWTTNNQPPRMPQIDGPMSLTKSSEKQLPVTIDGTMMGIKKSGAVEQNAHDDLAQPHYLDQPLVPNTLYPELDNERRPRDEDPNIMPIPRSYGFKFDARQLRDLAVIKEGGNGCARDGFEFEVEQDYELGGSGQMGLRQSSGKRFSSHTNGGEVYEYGKGDKEGLLAELPNV